MRLDLCDLLIMSNNIPSFSKVLPVILCGGSGTRLWPLSRSGFPKQLLCLDGDLSLLQQTAQRLMGIKSLDIEVDNPIVVTNEDLRFVVQEQMREVSLLPKRLLLEPVGRNTAPALTLAALSALEGGNDPILVVASSDQTIQDTPAYLASLHTAIQQADSGSVVVLGIKPTRPETGYGYIKISDSGDNNSYQVDRFIEKPDQLTAQSYLNEGDYYWNAGIFILKASVWIELISCFRPDIASSTEKAWALRSSDNGFIRPDPEAFAAIPSDSIDYAVIERCPAGPKSVRMVTLDAGWSDLGLWNTVWGVLPKDSNGNATKGQVITHDTNNCLVLASHRLVATVGVTGLVIVETSDAILVLDKSKSKDVKHVVNLLEKMKRNEHVMHRKVHRPWGWYDSIDEGEHFKVKRIQVNPGASLSLQKHFHRAEHWVVVNGTAKITNGSSTVLLTENQSTYIPLGVEHRLSNPGTAPLEIIEVQSGSYLSEDDIVRIKDDYGRSE